VPQLGLQQTKPVLQVAIPQVALNGYSMGLPHCLAVSHPSPGRIQIPQLLLQHSSPTLHVFEPQEGLVNTADMPHTCCEQMSPGGAQVPQLALQQTSRSGHCTFPHCTLIISGGGTTGLGNDCTNVASIVVDAADAADELEGVDFGMLEALGNTSGTLFWLDAISVELGIATEGWSKRTQMLRSGVSSRTSVAT
jgi:hypothetical protein